MISKMAALAGTMMAGGTRSAQPEPAPKQLPPIETAPAAVAALDTVGRENEAARNACADITRKFTEFTSMGPELDTLFGQFEQALNRLEEARSQLTQRDAVLTVVQEDKAKLKDTLNTVGAENERNKAELGLLRPDAQRLREKIVQHEARIDAVETEWNDVRANLAAANVQLQAEKSRAAFLNDSATSLRAELDNSDRLVSTLQGELADLRHNLNMSEESVRKLQAAVSDDQLSLTKFNSDLEAARIALEAERQRVSGLETELAIRESDHRGQRAQLSTDLDQARGAGAELQARLDQMTTLKEASERAHAEARLEIQAKNDEVRHAERRAREAQAALAAAENKIKAEAEAKDEALERLTDSEKNRTLLVGQIKPLLKGIEDKNIEIAKLEQGASALLERLDQENKSNAAERNRFDGAIKGLTERYEDEKARRALAEGALEEERRARVALQISVSSAKAPRPSLDTSRPMPAPRRKTQPLTAAE